jgi:hypothetical protein
MAGSYRHVTNDDGSFRGGDLLDGGGDVYEAVEEMYHMIQILSGGDQARIEQARNEAVKRCTPPIPKRRRRMRARDRE